MNYFLMNKTSNERIDNLSIDEAITHLLKLPKNELESWFYWYKGLDVWHGVLTHEPFIEAFAKSNSQGSGNEIIEFETNISVPSEVLDQISQSNISIENTDSRVLSESDLDISSDKTSVAEYGQSPLHDPNSTDEKIIEIPDLTELDVQLEVPKLDLADKPDESINLNPPNENSKSDSTQAETVITKNFSAEQTSATTTEPAHQTSATTTKATEQESPEVSDSTEIANPQDATQAIHEIDQTRATSDADLPPIPDSISPMVSDEILNDIGKTIVTPSGKGKERRRTKRFEISFRIMITNGDESFITHSNNISLGGIKLAHPMPEKFVGNECEIFIMHGKSRESVQLDCKIVGTIYERDRIAFSGGSSEVVAKLNSWLIENTTKEENEKAS